MNVSFLSFALHAAVCRVLGRRPFARVVRFLAYLRVVKVLLDLVFVLSCVIIFDGVVGALKMRNLEG